MGDLLHDDVPDEFCLRVFSAMAQAKRHQYLVLTKRSERLIALANEVMGDNLLGPHVWCGVSIENADYLCRLDALQRTPCYARFVSFEPLLGPVHDLDLRGIDWVIVGGESGPGARPMDPDWAREIRDQCIEQNAAFTFKQWGAWAPVDDTLRPGESTIGHRVRVVGNTYMWRIGKKRAGRVLDGRTWDEYAERRR